MVLQHFYELYTYMHLVFMPVYLYVLVCNQKQRLPHETRTLHHFFSSYSDRWINIKQLRFHSLAVFLCWVSCDVF